MSKSSFKVIINGIVLNKTNIIFYNYIVLLIIYTIFAVKIIRTR